MIQLIETSVAAGTTIFSPSVQSTWYTLETTATANTMYGRVNDGSWGSWDRAALTGNFGLHAANYVTGTHTSQYDWVLIRKYTATEPTHSSWNDISIPSGDTGRFRYKKTHILTGDSEWSGDQTGYPIMLKVYRTSGTDSGSSVYVDTNVRTDYRDLLFMDGNGCILPFWIESIDTTNNYATVWVRMPTIAKTGNTTLYMLYGNPRATDRSSGAATFDLFDDFLGTTLDATLWETDNSPDTVAVSGGILSVCENTAAWAGVKSKTSFDPMNIRVKGKVRLGASRSQFGLGNTYDLYTDADAAVFINWDGTASYRTNNEGTISDTTETAETSNYHIKEITFSNVSTRQIKFYNDGTLKATHTYGIQIVPDEAGQIRFIANSKATTYVDWVFVGKFISPEPAHGSWSTSEV